MTVTDSSTAIVIVGPTASGKTRRGVDIARMLTGEVISADSRQVYRGMTIGTGKDINEYDEIPYHLIDIVPAGHKYNLYEYIRDFNIAYSDIRSRGKRPVIVGGTGLYVETVLRGTTLPDVPENTELRSQLEGLTLAQLTDILGAMKHLHNTTDIDTTKRAIRAIEIEKFYQDHPDEAKKAKAPIHRLDAVIFGIDIDRENRRQRITDRLRQRLDEGMVDEVKNLLDSGIAPDDLIYYGLEYKYLTLYLTGHMNYEQMVGELNIAIHQFAKRQMTWFRGMEKRGFTINWLPFDMETTEFNRRVCKLADIIH